MTCPQALSGLESGPLRTLATKMLTFPMLRMIVQAPGSTVGLVYDARAICRAMRDEISYIELVRGAGRKTYGDWELFHASAAAAWEVEA